MAEGEINAFLTHLTVNKHVSVPRNAGLFLYRHVLNQEIGDLGKVSAPANQNTSPSL